MRLQEAPVVVANHLSFVDPIFMVSQFLPSPVGAAEVLAFVPMTTFFDALC